MSHAVALIPHHWALFSVVHHLRCLDTFPGPRRDLLFRAGGQIFLRAGSLSLELCKRRGVVQVTVLNYKLPHIPGVFFSSETFIFRADLYFVFPTFHLAF